MSVFTRQCTANEGLALYCRINDVAEKCTINRASHSIAAVTFHRVWQKIIFFRLFIQIFRNVTLCLQAENSKVQNCPNHFLKLWSCARRARLRWTHLMSPWCAVMVQKVVTLASSWYLFTLCWSWLEITQHVLLTPVIEIIIRWWWKLDEQMMWYNFFEICSCPSTLLSASPPEPVFAPNLSTRVPL